MRAGNANASAEVLKLTENSDTTALKHFIAGIAQLADDAIADALKEFDGKTPEEIRQQRHERFLQIGRTL